MNPLGGRKGVMTPDPIIQKAISLAGSQQRLSELSGLSQQFISKLLLRQRGISAEASIAIETATDGAVDRSELRPDLWPASAPPSMGDAA